MSRPIVLAVKLTRANGQTAFLRRGGWGRGPIANFRSLDTAEAAADTLRNTAHDGDVITVIARSHGKVGTDE